MQGVNISILGRKAGYRSEIYTTVAKKIGWRNTLHTAVTQNKRGSIFAWKITDHEPHLHFINYQHLLPGM
ncbi:hypothetical protein GCM10023092_05410 [Rurimicrobium arvi]|uniref:Uncharacterized protein n=1 Tax=Rurimicrobium arvi TaxID=2049916 RepID=A0ABP8MK15_9BACT